MPVPVLLLAGLGLAAALAASSKGGSGGTVNPDDVFDHGMPSDLVGGVTVLLQTSKDPKTLYDAAVSMQNMGYTRAANALLAACNHYREAQGLPDLPSPPSGYYPGSGPGGGGGGGLPVTPASTTTPGGPTPQGTTIATPVGPVTIPVAIPGTVSSQPPTPPPTGVQPPSGLPGVTPIPPPQGTNTTPPQPGIMGNPPDIGTALTTLTNLLGGGGGGPAPPTGVPGGGTVAVAPPGAYPAGTHLRPDGTVGYTTQTGDVTTQIIASKFGQDHAALMAANPGVDWNHNYVGSDLNLPAAWLSHGVPQPGARGKAPPGGTSPGQHALTGAPPPGTPPAGFPNIPVGNPAGVIPVAQSFIPGSGGPSIPGVIYAPGAPPAPQLPPGASIDNGQLMYIPQKGDYNAEQVAKRFGHPGEGKTLVNMNVGYPWTKGGKKLKVPNAWVGLLATFG